MGQLQKLSTNSGVSPVGLTPTSETEMALRKTMNGALAARLKASRISLAGLKWAIDHLDPAGAHFDSPGIPDRCTGYRHIHQTRFQAEVIPNSTWALADGQTWDLLWLGIPGLNFVAFAIRKKSGDAWPVVDVYNKDSNPYVIDSFTTDITAGTSWVETNADGKANVMKVFFFPDQLGSNSAATIATDYSKARINSRSFTFDMTGPEIYRSGRITSGQVPVDGVNGSFAMSNANAFGPNLMIRLPTGGGSSGLLAADRLAATRKASEGDYNVLRLNVPTGIPPYVATISGGRPYILNDSDGPAKLLAPSTALSLFVVLDTSYNMSMTYMEGLSNKEVVFVRAFGSIEGIPQTSSRFSEITTISPVLDQGVIDLVADIESELSHSFPSSYNDLGGLLGKIGSIFRSVGLPVAKFLGGMGIPVVSPIANAIREIADTLS